MGRARRLVAHPSPCLHRVLLRNICLLTSSYSSVFWRLTHRNCPRFAHEPIPTNLNVGKSSLNHCQHISDLVAHHQSQQTPPQHTRPEPLPLSLPFPCRGPVPRKRWRAKKAARDQGGRPPCRPISRFSLAAFRGARDPGLPRAAFLADVGGVQGEFSERACMWGLGTAGVALTAN